MFTPTFFWKEKERAAKFWFFFFSFFPSFFLRLLGSVWAEQPYHFRLLILDLFVVTCRSSGQEVVAKKSLSKSAWRVSHEVRERMRCDITAASAYARWRCALACLPLHICLMVSSVSVSCSRMLLLPSSSPPFLLLNCMQHPVLTFFHSFTRLRSLPLFFRFCLFSSSPSDLMLTHTHTHRHEYRADRASLRLLLRVCVCEDWGWCRLYRMPAIPSPDLFLAAFLPFSDRTTQWTRWLAACDAEDRVEWFFSSLPVVESVDWNERERVSLWLPAGKGTGKRGNELLTGVSSSFLPVCCCTQDEILQAEGLNCFLPEACSTAYYWLSSFKYSINLRAYQKSDSSSRIFCPLFAPDARILITWYQGAEEMEVQGRVNFERSWPRSLLSPLFPVDHTGAALSGWRDRSADSRDLEWNDLAVYSLFHVIRNFIKFEFGSFAWLEPGNSILNLLMISAHGPVNPDTCLESLSLAINGPGSVWISQWYGLDCQ